MKVYFTAAISQKPDLEQFYLRISKYLTSKGFDVNSGNLFHMDEKAINEAQDKTRLNWYNQAIKNIVSSDLVIVEISFPSTVNIGHELSIALEKKKPVIALFKSDRDPIFLRGRDQEKFIISAYTENDLEAVLGASVDYATGQQDTRFNFFISPEISSYLDWTVKKRRVPRAVYLRRLIEEDMKQNKEYQG